MTEKEKMLAGEVYSAVDEELIRELNDVREIIHDYNMLRPSAHAEKLRILIEDKELRDRMGKAARTKAERDFDRQTVVNAYLKELNGICHV